MISSEHQIQALSTYLEIFVGDEGHEADENGAAANGKLEGQELCGATSAAQSHGDAVIANDDEATVEEEEDEKSGTDDETENGDGPQGQSEPEDDEEPASPSESYQTPEAVPKMFFEMKLQDEQIVLAFRRAILGCPDLYRGKVVLDDSGTFGLLAQFACRAGAAIAIVTANTDREKAKIEEIAVTNGMAGQFRVTSGPANDLQLPQDWQHVDVIFSCWMGECLFARSSKFLRFLTLRSRFLKVGSGLVAPQKVSLHLTALTDKEGWTRVLQYWTKPLYELDMGIMRKVSLSEPEQRYVGRRLMASSSCCVATYDLLVDTAKELQKSSGFVLNIRQTGTLHSFLLYFDADLPIARPKGSQRCAFTTAPGALKPTSAFTQTVLYLDRPLKVDAGNVVRGSFALSFADRSSLGGMTVKLKFEREATISTLDGVGRVIDQSGEQEYRL